MTLAAPVSPRPSMQAQERITLPFRVQSFTPPEAYKVPPSPAWLRHTRNIAPSAGRTRAPSTAFGITCCLPYRTRHHLPHQPKPLCTLQSVRCTPHSCGVAHACVQGALKPSDLQVNKSVKVDKPATAPATATGHSVMVEFVNGAAEQPVSVLELEIVPRAMIIDRTFR